MIVAVILILSILTTMDITPPPLYMVGRDGWIDSWMDGSMDEWTVEWTAGKGYRNWSRSLAIQPCIVIYIATYIYLLLPPHPPTA